MVNDGAECVEMVIREKGESQRVKPRDESKSDDE